MFGTDPQRLFSDAFAALMDELGGLRDGDEQAIHKARVAIRRLRESLPLVREDYSEDDLRAVDERLTHAFKALGRARDADTAQRLVQHVEMRFPLAPAMLGHLRLAIAREQLLLRRRLIKALEAADIANLPEQFSAARRRERRMRRSPSWREALRLHVRNRAADLQQAVEHAGGVYFPKRTHDTRVALKQFRYALELARATGIWRAPGALRVLRKTQDALGDAHDREVLIARVHSLVNDGVAVEPGEARAIEHFLAGEIRGLHEQYLAARPRIRETCQASLSARRQLPVRTGAMALAALALPVVIARRRS
jgi:CHAD domain-containing protein